MSSKGSKTYQTDKLERDKMNDTAEAGKVGVKVALDGRFDDRGSTPRHRHHRHHYRHSYSD